MDTHATLITSLALCARTYQPPEIRGAEESALALLNNALEKLPDPAEWLRPGPSGEATRAEIAAIIARMFVTSPGLVGALVKSTRPRDEQQARTLEPGCRRLVGSLLEDVRISAPLAPRQRPPVPFFR